MVQEEVVGMSGRDDADLELYLDLYDRVYNRIEGRSFSTAVADEFCRLYRGRYNLGAGEAMQRALLHFKLLDPSSNARLEAVSEEYEEIIAAQDLMGL